MNKVDIGLLFIFQTVLCSCLVVTGLINTKVKSLDTPCKDFQIIYARGSGQSIDHQPERDKLVSELSKYLEINNNFIEVDKTQMSSTDHDYPAVPVFGMEDGGFMNGGLAIISGAKLGRYSESVTKGSNLLVEYLSNSNFNECETKLVLAGYSQGAQLIGDTLFKKELMPLYDNISSIILFGDPKLDNNSLIGGAIFGKNQWYRGSATKYFTNGLLQARNPYIPTDLASKTGSWCGWDDGICTGNIIKLGSEFSLKPHSKYPEKMIPQAAAEIATRLSQDLKDPLPLPACGAPKQDVILNIDMSPTVRADDKTFGHDKLVDYKLKQVFASSCHTRVAVHGYWQPEDNREPQALLDFTDNYNEVRSLLTDLYEPSSETMITPTQAREGILSALDMDWRPDAEKVILTISNVGGTGDGWQDNMAMNPPKAFIEDPLTRQVIQKSYEVGGVELWHAQANRDIKNHTVKAPASYYYFSTFYEATGGNMVKSSCGSGKFACSWDLRAEQVPKIAVQTVRGTVGTATAVDWVDISRGVLSTSNPVYRWYLTCDGAHFSFVTHKEAFSHTFTKPQQCIGAVITHTNHTYCNYCGGPTFSRSIYDTSIATFPIIIGDGTAEPELVAPLPIQNLSKVRYDDHISYEWDAPANADQLDELAYVIRDQDGVVVAITRNPRLHIVDLPENEPIISVSVATDSAHSPEVISDISPLIDKRTAPDESTETLQDKPTLYQAISDFDNTPRVGGNAITQPVTQTIQLAALPQSRPDTLGVSLRSPFEKPATSHRDASRSNTLRLSVVAVPLAVLATLGISFIGYNAIISLRNWR